MELAVQNINQSLLTITSEICGAWPPKIKKYSSSMETVPHKFVTTPSIQIKMNATIPHSWHPEIKPSCHSFDVRLNILCNTKYLVLHRFQHYNSMADRGGVQGVRTPPPLSGEKKYLKGKKKKGGHGGVPQSRHGPKQECHLALWFLAVYLLMARDELMYMPYMKFFTSSDLGWPLRGHYLVWVVYVWIFLVKLQC